MKKMVFIGLLATGLFISMNGVAQERVRSNQIKRQLNQTEQNVRRDIRGSTDSITNQFERRRSDFNEAGDTLRNRYDRTRSGYQNVADTLRNEYDRTRREYRNEIDQNRMRVDSLDRLRRRNW